MLTLVSHTRWRASVATAAAAGLVALGLALAPAARATTYPTETASWGGANLLSYDDSDFENGLGTWVVPSGGNSTISQDTTTSFLHNASLLMTATTAGTQEAQAMGAPGNNVIPVKAGDEYRLSAWVKTGSAVSGRTVTFSAGFRDSNGNFLSRVDATAQTLAGSTAWQYVSGTIIASTGAAYLAYPRITEANVSAGEMLKVDEVMILPYRASVLIGAEDPSNDGSQFSYANSTIGPLQVDKLFETGSLPSSYNGSKCDTVQTAEPGVTCEYAYSTPTTNVAKFVQSIPSGQNVILVYCQEDEHNCPNASQFVSDDEAQANLVHSSVTSANKENVFFAEDSAGSQYVDNGPAVGCNWIVPGKYIDFYLVDLYQDNASGKSLNQVGSDRWDNWIYCVGPQDKPIGLGEYGLNGLNSPYYANGQTTYQAMISDNSYLEAQQFEAYNNGVHTGVSYNLPMIDWMYWWRDGPNPGYYWQFTPGGNPDGTQAVDHWQSNETQNGGGAN